MPSVNRQIHLAAKPFGLPKETDFALVESPMPEVGDGQFLVRTNYLSVDPYMRGLITGAKSYAKPVRPGDLMIGGTVGTVVSSRNPEHREGEVVVGYWGWQEFAAITKAHRFDTSVAPMPAALGVLGMPGMTAYFGLLEIGRPKPGETVFVSGAAGSVGSTVGQIAKLRRCKVVGSAGSQEKVDYLVKELDFDAAFNYKETDNYFGQLRHACPDGIDVYFDNVGGPLGDAVFMRINAHARVVICGQIDQYNSTEIASGPRVLWLLIVKQARAEGFLVDQFFDRRDEFLREMTPWIKEGKIKHRETITDGLENAPKAFIGLFKGENTGKQLVRVCPE